MKYRILISILAFYFIALPAQAQDTAKPVVVELFTTQGCSSCPPADALVKKLQTEDPAIITLACHVDYFDDMGWKDTMARPLCSQRHAAYEKSLSLYQIATPTVIIDGKFPVIGANEKLVRDGIKMARSLDTLQEIQVSKREDNLDFTLPALRLEKPADVIFAGFGNPRTVHITEGENAGQNIDYTRPVLYMFKLFSWNGSYKTDSVPLTAYPAQSYGILVQEQDTGPILAAKLTN